MSAPTSSTPPTSDHHNVVIPLLVGPTAVGKTALSLEMAVELGGEIISADARQIYRGLDIGTAKPSILERRGIAHHFVDELDVGESFSAGQFARMAERRIESILRRGRVPLVVGGSTLYVEALVNGVADIPDIAPEIRIHLNHRLGRDGAPRLFEELSLVDPQSAETMDETKSQRIVRALEVFHGTGRPLSFYHQHRVQPAFRFRGLVLERDRRELYDRINSRVDVMLAQGLVDEVTNLIERGVDVGANALQTIGYREVVGLLQGVHSYSEMVRLLKRNTRRYAKRQITWFKRYSEFAVVHADTPLTEIRNLI